MVYTFYIILSIALIGSITMFTMKRTLNYLHIFQQQEYDSKRFLLWIINGFYVDKRLTLTLLIFLGTYTGLLWNFIRYPGINWELKCSITAIIIFIFAILEKNPLMTAKKKLVLTNRAKRIYYIGLLLNFISNVYLILNLNAKNHLINLLLAIHLIPLYLIIANSLLEPVENYIQKKIWRQAKEKLANLNPIIVGITGSFGKTSVKHFLGHILKQADHTLITAGSINTTMGIARTIREELNPNHKYFIVEMGAYYTGSIEKICELTSPDLGIITAIGTAHYERFKDLETVANAKFELSEAVIKKYKLKLDQTQENTNKLEPDNSKTIMIIPEQVINTNYAKVYMQTNKSYFTILDPHNINNIVQTKTGLSWDLNLNGINYKIETPIFGLHNVTNLSLAFITAYNLNIPVASIMAAIKTMPQINHRLEVLKQNNFTIIDDSYNSNPDGLRSALELLSFLHEPPAKRILITPGLVELGNKHEEEHFHLGIFAANHVDLAIIVNPKRIKSFIAGFKQNASLNQELIQVASFKEANDWIKLNCKHNDLVLIANDLPDLYENGLQI